MNRFSVIGYWCLKIGHSKFMVVPARSKPNAYTRYKVAGKEGKKYICKYV